MTKNERLKDKDKVFGFNQSRLLIDSSKDSLVVTMVDKISFVTLAKFLANVRPMQDCLRVAGTLVLVYPPPSLRVATV